MFGPRFGPHFLVHSATLPQNLTRVNYERPVFEAADESRMLHHFSYIRHLILILKDAISSQ